MCVVIHAFDLESVCVCVENFIDQQMQVCVCVCVWWEAGNQMDLWEIKSFYLFIPFD